MLHPPWRSTVAQVFSPQPAHLNVMRLPFDFAFQRTPPISQMFVSWPHSVHLTIHSRDARSIASALPGIRRVKEPLSPAHLTALAVESLRDLASIALLTRGRPV